MISHPAHPKSMSVLPLLVAAGQLVAACQIDASAPVHPKGVEATTSGSAPASQAPPIPESAAPESTAPAQTNGLPPAPDCPAGAVPRTETTEAGEERFCEKDGKRHGRYTRLHAEGAKAEEVDYVDGLQQGLFVGWEATGALRETGTFKDGQRTGRWRSYMEGKIAFEGDFEAGAQNGGFIAWHGTGNKQGEGRFRHGEPCGPFKCWEPDGTPAGCVPLDGKCMLTKTGALCPACPAE